MGAALIPQEQGPGVPTIHDPSKYRAVQEGHCNEIWKSVMATKRKYRRLSDLPLGKPPKLDMAMIVAKHPHAVSVRWKDRLFRYRQCTGCRVWYWHESGK